MIYQVSSTIEVAHVLYHAPPRRDGGWSATATTEQLAAQGGASVAGSWRPRARTTRDAGSCGEPKPEFGATPARMSATSAAAAPREGQRRPSQLCKAPWAEPSPALPLDHASATLTDEQVAHWHREGYAVVNGVLPPELVAAECAEAILTYPDMGPADTSPPPRQGANDFPFDMPAKNDASVHPRLLRAVAQLLDTEAIRLSECQVWCKYGEYYNADQPEPKDGQRPEEVHELGDQGHHLDYGNGTLVVPVVESFREEVAIIMYLGTLEETGGATAVLPRSHSAAAREVAQSAIHRGGFGSRSGSPDFYAAEKQVHGVPGTILFYRFDTFHRGTPVKDRCCRRIHSIVYRREDCPWIQWDVWAKHLGTLETKTMSTVFPATVFFAARLLQIGPGKNFDLPSLPSCRASHSTDDYVA